MKPYLLLPAATLVLLAAIMPAAAYTCTVSAHGDTVTIKTDNSSTVAKTCTVTCRFAYARISCTQNIPAGAKGRTVCVRPTRGKNLGALQGGQELCR